MSRQREIDVPDCIRPYLNEIANGIWNGRAAVMVGAGFSKNAEEKFPDWSQLGDLFYEAAYGQKPESGRQKYLDILKLAEEVQASIGRPALENLLRSNIPDLTIEPSDLHVRLLEFPWSDVFTTNYDTLLERASAKVVTRRYEPVVNKEDIPYATKPRIVKLHGSFPSERPFIITEEDYRRYPYEYAPFVNTVQQSFLENTFCLIGFSGNDPNFLQWTGWIRDNLGPDKTQKIYLVGAFDFSEARLQLLAQRGIIVVDMSQCPEIGKQDHKKALRKFFDYMRLKKPDILDWPFTSQLMNPSPNGDPLKQIQDVVMEWGKQRQCYPGWLILPESNRNTLWINTKAWINHHPELENAPELDIQYAFELNWRLERCLLPIFPHLAELHEKLLEKYWPFSGSSPFPKCKFSLDNGQCHDHNLRWKDIREAWLAIALAQLRFYREDGFLDKWEKMYNHLLDLSEDISADQLEFLHYEAVLFSLFALDLPEVRKRLESWRPGHSQPYWMAKRAAILAEIGQADETKAQIHESLYKIRTQGINSSYPLDYSHVSKESYTMVLLMYVGNASRWDNKNSASVEERQAIKANLEAEWKFEKRNKFYEELNIRSKYVKESEKPSNFVDDWEDLTTNCNGKRKLEWDWRLSDIRNKQWDPVRKQLSERLNELKAFKCEPWNELKLFELALDKPFAAGKSISEKREFDVGRITRTRHLEYTDQDGLNAYAFLRFCEEAGLPFRIGIYSLDKKAAAASLPRVAQYSLYWATATLARLGETKAVDSLFSREPIYKFSIKEANRLVRQYLDVLENGREDIHCGDGFSGDTLGIRLAKLLPEVISRLCCKCSSEPKQRILDFIARIYASPYKVKYGSIRNLFRRLLDSMSPAEQYQLVPELLQIQYPENMSPVVKDDFPNPFFFLGIDEKPVGKGEAPKLDQVLVSKLYQQAATGNPDQRRWAIFSLVTLHRLKLLDENQAEELGEVLWPKRYDKFELPFDTDFYKFAFLTLPHPKEIDPVVLFKKYVTEACFPIQSDDKGVALTGGKIPIINEILGANAVRNEIWTSDDAVEILNRLVEWWDTDKKRLKNKDQESPVWSSGEEFVARFSRIIEVIAEVVGPKLCEASPGDAKSSLDRLLREMQEHGLPVLQAEAACLHLFPDRKDNFYVRINDTLISNQSEQETDGLKGVATIILKSNSGVTDSELNSALSILGQFLTWRRKPSLVQALWIVIRLIKNIPTHFTENFETVVLKCLDMLAGETAYEHGDTGIGFDEKLEIRKTTALLAATLYTHYEVSGLNQPQAVGKWQSICRATDEFAEIRSVWDAGE